MKSDANNPCVESPSTPAQPPVEQPPKPTPPTPAELFHSDPKFKEGVLEMARSLAKLAIEPERQAAANQVRSQFVAKCKANAINKHLARMEFLHVLLPDTDDPELMEKEAQRLCSQLQWLGPIVPTFPQKQRMPTAAELLAYDLRIRNHHARF